MTKSSDRRELQWGRVRGDKANMALDQYRLGNSTRLRHNSQNGGPGPCVPE